MKEKQNRVIVFGMVVSTMLITAIAIFATINIQKNLKESYKNFGQVISKTLAIESADLIKNIPQNNVKKVLKSHSDLILKSHKDIVFIEFKDPEGNLIYKAQNLESKESSIAVSSPMISAINNQNLGAVTIGLSGNITEKVSSTTRASILFVFTIVWHVFAFVVLIKADTVRYRMTLDKKAVRKNVSIPSWLNQLALRQNLNFSYLLQKALMKELNLF